MLGTQTQGGMMEGADKSTELWQHPLHYYNTFSILDSSKIVSTKNGGSEDGGLMTDLAPPVFTSETKNAPKISRKSVGESFQVISLQCFIK